MHLFFFSLSCLIFDISILCLIPELFSDLFHSSQAKDSIFVISQVMEYTPVAEEKLKVTVITVCHLSSKCIGKIFGDLDWWLLLSEVEFEKLEPPNFLLTIIGSTQLRSEHLSPLSRLVFSASITCVLFCTDHMPCGLNNKQIPLS